MAQLAERRKELVTGLMKDAIYAAAVEILTKQGVDGLTMDRVAETAGVAKGRLYNYFDNKRDLIDFVYDKTVEPAKLIFQEVVAKKLSAREKLEQMLRRWFDYFATNRGIFSFLFENPGISDMADAHKRSSRREGIADLTVIFQQGVDEGAFRAVNPARVAEMFLGAVIISIEQQIASDEQRPTEESVGALMDLFLKGLEPRG